MIGFANNTQVRVIAADDTHPALAKFGVTPGGTTAQLIILERNNPSPVYQSG